jgi:phage terminase large subunit GpA-like protein
MADAVELFACLRATRPASIGFHTPAWISSFVSLSRSASAIIRAASKGIDEVKDLATNYAAEPWREYRQKREDDKILLLQDDRPRGMVPSGNMVACLVAGVDTQDTGFYYKIIAVGYGQVQNIWVVQYGFVLDFEALEKVLWWHTYKDASGKDYPVQLVLQDAMGHRTADVYDFCRKYKGYIFPSKGERTKAQRFSYSNMEFYPGTKKSIPGGLQLVSVNTTYYKNALGNKLDVEPSDPGAIRLHSETDADYASQMTAEYRDAETGTWECPPSRANHYWDCMVLALVAADILDVKKWPTPEEVAAGPEEYVKSQSSYIKR